MSKIKMYGSTYAVEKEDRIVFGLSKEKAELMVDIDDIEEAIRKMRTWAISTRDKDWNDAVRWLNELLVIKEGELYKDGTNQPPRYSWERL